MDPFGLQERAQDINFKKSACLPARLRKLNAQLAT
jgi:hypothetical protein